MSKRILRVLIIEDNEIVRLNYEKLFNQLPPDFVAQYGHIPFDIKPSCNMKDAIDMIKSYRDSGMPFDIALVDLHIPPKPESTHEEAKIVYGQRVLKSFRPEDATAVVVITRYDNWKQAKEAFQAGALDYLTKPVRPQRNILDAAMNAWYKTWLRCRNQDLSIELSQLNWALDQSQDEVADRFAGLLTEHACGLLANMGDLSNQLENRYMLSIERDISDPIIKCIRSINETTKDTLKRVAELRSQSSRAEAHYTTIDLTVMLDEVVNSLWPVFAFHHLRPQLTATAETVKIRTFEEDLRSILNELISGTVNAYPVLDSEGPTPRQWQDLKIKLEQRQQSVYIEIVDRAELLDQSVCEMINKGFSVGRGNQRAWGLSLAQRMAHNIGASINIGLNEQGTNCISLRIPVA